MCFMFVYVCCERDMAQRVERWTCDQQVVSSNPTRGKKCVTTLGIRVISGRTGSPDPTLWSGRRTPHFISTPRAESPTFQKKS